MEEQNILSGSSFGFFWFKSQTYRGSQGGAGAAPTPPAGQINQCLTVTADGRTDGDAAHQRTHLYHQRSIVVTAPVCPCAGLWVKCSWERPCRVSSCWRRRAAPAPLACDCSWFYFLEGGITAIECDPENPTMIYFLSLTEKKTTKGFSKILLLICVKVAQISKYVAAKQVGGRGEVFSFV